MSNIKRFAFNLEPVLQYRTRREEEAVVEQAGAERRRRQREEILARTRAVLDESLAARPDPAANVAELMHVAVYHVHLKRLVDHQTAEVQEAAREWAVCRERTVARHRDRLVLEKLKEKKEAVFLKELAVREQKEDDEISLRLHAARRGGH